MLDTALGRPEKSLPPPPPLDELPPPLRCLAPPAVAALLTVADFVRELGAGLRLPAEVWLRECGESARECPRLT